MDTFSTLQRMNMKWYDRAKNRMKELNLQQKDFAKPLGVGPSAVGHYFSGRREPSPEQLKTIAKMLQTGIDDLFQNGEPMVKNGSIAESGTLETINMPSKNQQIPLISWVSAGKWTLEGNMAEVDVERWLPPCPVQHTEKTFALRVRGASMEPILYDGEIIYVDPQAEPTNGKIVVARLDGGDSTLKRLIIEPDGKRYLKAANPEFPDIYLHVSETVTIIGVVVFAGRIL